MLKQLWNSSHVKAGHYGIIALRLCDNCKNKFKIEAELARRANRSTRRVASHRTGEVTDYRRSLVNKIIPLFLGLVLIPVQVLTLAMAAEVAHVLLCWDSRGIASGVAAD